MEDFLGGVILQTLTNCLIVPTQVMCAACCGSNFRPPLPQGVPSPCRSGKAHFPQPHRSGEAFVHTPASIAASLYVVSVL